MDARVRGTEAASCPAKSSGRLSSAAPDPRTADPLLQRAGAVGVWRPRVFCPVTFAILVKTRCFVNCVFGPGFLSKSLGFTILFPPSGRSTTPA